jgi:two-component system response regulator GlrR
MALFRLEEPGKLLASVRADAAEDGAVSSTVLVVEDDPEMRRLLRDALGQDGFLVWEETSADSLVEALERQAPNLVVLDKELPGPGGLDVLSYLATRHPSIPVVLITAFGSPAVRVEALRRGATVYLEKPFRVGALLGHVHALVKPGAVGGDRA